MKFKIKRILAVMLVFCMMMGVMPNMLMTAHAASNADAIKSININGISITNLDGQESGFGWEYDANQPIPTIFLNNYDGGPIQVFGKDGETAVYIRIHVTGNCSISASGNAVELFASDYGSIEFTLTDGSSLSMEGWSGVNNESKLNPIVTFNGNGKVNIEATGGYGIIAQSILDSFNSAGTISVTDGTQLVATAPGLVAKYGESKTPSGFNKVNLEVKSGASVKFVSTGSDAAISSEEGHLDAITKPEGYEKNLSTDGKIFKLYKPVAYTISFEGGRTAISDATTDGDGKLTSLPTPTAPLDSWEFEGWYTAAEGGEKVTTDTVFTSDTTLYARWNKPVEPIEITEIVINGVDAPVENEDVTEAPSFTLPDGANYVVESAQWMHGINDQAVSFFIVGNDYRAVFKVVPKEGYKFASVPTMTINGENASVRYNIETEASIFITLTAVADGGDVTPPCEHANKELDKDADGHWYVCPDCEDLAKDVKDHEYDDDLDANCNVCGYEREITVPEPECDHANKELDKDATGHWYVCPDCGELAKDVKDHEYDDNADATCNVCGYEREIVVPPVTPSIELNKDTLALVVPNSEKLIATVTPEGLEAYALSWSSSDPDVATVDENGKVTAVAAGTATITVTLMPGAVPTAEDEVVLPTATCVVTVTEKVVTPPAEEGGTTTPTTPSTPNVPDTGDNTNTLGWMITLLFTMVALVIVIKKKKEINE